MGILSNIFKKTKADDADGAKELRWDIDPGQLIYPFDQSTAFHGSYGAIYRKQPAVRTVVDFLARNIAQLHIYHFERLNRTEVLPLDESDLTMLLNKPAPFAQPPVTKYRLLFGTVADLGIYDMCFWQKIRDPRGTVRAVVRVPVPSMIPEREGGRVIGYRRSGDGAVIPLSDLVVFPGYSPEGDGGVSPIETLRRTLAEDWAAIVHREHFWRNAARQHGVIERPLDAPEWSEPALKRFREDWESVMSGTANAGRTAILEDGMTFNSATFSARESEYLDARKLTREEVAAAYHIPPQMIGIMEHNRTSSMSEAHVMMYQDTLAPILERIEEEIDGQLLPEFSRFDAKQREFVKFNIEEKLKGSFEKEAALLTSATGGPWMSRNEARGRKGLPRIDKPEYDEIIVPMNVTVGGQPAPNVPTEVPQPGPKRRGKKASVPKIALRRRDEAAKRFEKELSKFFDRQGRVVLSRLGAKRKADDDRPVFDKERWDRELESTLYSLAVAEAADQGKRAAEQIDGTYDEKPTLEYLQTKARIAAEEINRQTMEQIEALDTQKGVKAADDEDEPDPAEVFEDAKENRAPMLGMSLATSVINFARKEAGGQNGAYKRWVVTSKKSRHPEMNGDTVKAYDAFKNGAQYPGDPVALTVDDNAGCKCMLAIEK